MAARGGAGVLEKSEKKFFLDDTTPLIARIILNRVVPKQNYVVGNFKRVIGREEASLFFLQEYVMRVWRGTTQDDFWEVRV